KPILLVAVALISRALPLFAQAPAANAPASPPAQAPALAAQAESSVPATGDWLTGWAEVGYRWNTGPGGSLETYRSVVNLGSGPKLIGTEFTITDPGHRLF